MPNYVHLLSTKLNFKALPERIKAASLLGAKYDFSPEEAPEKAIQQAQEIAEAMVKQGGPKDKDLYQMQVIAMIAYLQRLGADINRPDPTPAEVKAAEVKAAKAKDKDNDNDKADKSTSKVAARVTGGAQ